MDNSGTTPQTISSEFNEIYRIEFLNDQKIDFESELDFKFYTSCTHYSEYNWYFESYTNYGTRKIYPTLTFPVDMNYENTHIRLYALSGISVGGTMPSNNIEIGYRWGKSTLHDITMTRQSDILYPIGYNTFNAMSFTGTDAGAPGG